MPGLREDCWICQGIREPAYLILYETKTSLAKLNPDQLFKGYTFLTIKWHEEQLHQLPKKQQTSFLEDATTVGKALAKTLEPDRVNYELLGNAQPHLHWHIIPRYRTDPMWGRPIWAGNRTRKRLTRDDYDQLVQAIKNNLPKARTAKTG